MAATIKTMRTYLTLRQSDSLNQSSNVLNFKDESPKRSRITSTIFSYSGEPVVAYLSRFLFSSPSSSLMTRRVISSMSLLEAVNPTNGQLYINGGQAIRICTSLAPYSYSTFTLSCNWVPRTIESSQNSNRLPSSMARLESASSLPPANATPACWE